MRRTCLALIGGLLVYGLFASKSQALPQFKKAFEEKAAGTTYGELLKEHKLPVQ